MLPHPRHLLKTDPQDVLRDIEDDSLSQFLWSFRPNLTKMIHNLTAHPTPRQDAAVVTDCCPQR